MIKLLSNFACFGFNCNLRRYGMVLEDVHFAGHVACFEGSEPRILYCKLQSLAGRCRFTPGFHI